MRRLTIVKASRTTDTSGAVVKKEFVITQCGGLEVGLSSRGVWWFGEKLLSL